MGDRYELEDDIELRDTYNAAPGQMLPVIPEDTGKVELMHWSFLPPWSKSLNDGYKMINARAETVDTLRSYKAAFTNKRCIIPATGFFEWKKSGKEKIPFWFHLKSNEIFTFAGLYSAWHDEKGKELRSFTIITTTPNKIVEDVHDRMPVILKREDEKRWLDPDIIEANRLKDFLLPYPEKDMDSYIVSPRVNSPKNNDLEIIKPFKSPEQGSLNSL